MSRHARTAAESRAIRRAARKGGRGATLGWGSAAVVVLMAAGGVFHATTGHHASAAGGSAAAAKDTGATLTTSQDGAQSRGSQPPAPVHTAIPGLGASFAAKIPANSSQVLLVSGAGKDANTATATLWTKGADGSWTAGASWPARNALRGWTTEHHLDDLRSPIGVFSLTDAGGLKSDPGTRLPYTHSSDFTAVGTGFEGESLADAFDYVVAINYNHVPGSSPLDARRPLGEERGGGIWVHVDHGGPTHGCVALPEADVRALLTELDPSKHPVIAMGDSTSLAA